MSGTVTEVWVAVGGGRDIVRADAIVMLRLDETGRLTAQLRDDAKVSVSLLEGSSGSRPPDDFHRQLIRAIAELADSSGAQLVRARHEGESGTGSMNPSKSRPRGGPGEQVSLFQLRRWEMWNCASSAISSPFPKSSTSAARRRASTSSSRR